MLRFAALTALLKGLSDVSGESLESGKIFFLNWHPLLTGVMQMTAADRKTLELVQINAQQPVALTRLITVHWMYVAQTPGGQADINGTVEKVNEETAG